MKQVNINGRWGYASSVAILVLIFVSIVGFRAIRPIEQAQEETLEELVGVGDAGRGAGRAGRRGDRGGGEGLMAAAKPQSRHASHVVEVPSRSIGHG